MGHANARLTVHGRLFAVQRVAAVYRIADVEARLGRSRTRTTSGAAATTQKVLRGSRIVRVARGVPTTHAPGVRIGSSVVGSVRLAERASSARDMPPASSRTYPCYVRFSLATQRPNSDSRH